MKAYREMYAVCQEAGWGDPFSYARGKEMYMAAEFGHTVATTLSGADGFNAVGAPVEYKSTIGERISGTYNGISKMPTWAEQEEYLLHKKLGCYSEHYIAQFARDRGHIKEAFMLTGTRICDILIPKLKKQYPTVHTRKDPRLGASLTKTEIYKYGKRIK
jgi:hypothetical protein